VLKSIVAAIIQFS